MTAYLGPAGGLVPFRCPSAVAISTDRTMSYRTTLNGRVKVQRGPASRRQWQVEIGSATPQELANLQALGEAGTPPWVWVEPYAQVTNLFTPDQSTLAPGAWSGEGFVQGGAVTVDDSSVPRSVLHPSGGSITMGLRHGAPDRPSVVPGVKLSASVCARGEGSLILFWHNWTGSTIGSVRQDYNLSTLGRVEIAGTLPPAGAASVRLVTAGAFQLAMPCLTWTPDTPSWSIGRGCTRAVVEGLSESVRTAVKEGPHPRRRSALSFTVREVG